MAAPTTPGDGAAGVTPQPGLCSGSCTIAFASGTDWAWFSGDLGGVQGTPLGNAALVCVNATTPPNCPSGAVIYRSGGSGWMADTSAFPDAHWIWRGDVEPDAAADLQYAVFQKAFVLGAHPSGSIEIAADDLAEVLVNGQVAASTGSVTDVSVAWQAQSTLKLIELGPFLVEGTNTLTVVGQNGPASFAGGACSPCTYATNTAGVVFAGTFTYK
jgi:hypothetical protein